ncbi:MAG: YbjN domain-containing protein [Xanthomonadaceae bacterium]|nr:YbjN domain-containing protein [Xanthomonadaceae bacterium]
MGLSDFFKSKSAGTDSASGEKHPDAGPLMREMIQSLENDNWTYDYHPDRNLIYTGVKGKKSHYRLIMSANEKSQTVCVMTVHPTLTPEERRAAMAEFLTRANYGLTVGNFEMDFRDGEVRYRVGYDVEGGRFTAKMADNMVICAYTMMDRYAAGLVGLVHQGKTVLEAIEAVEGKKEGEAG